MLILPLDHICGHVMLQCAQEIATSLSSTLESMHELSVNETFYLNWTINTKSIVKADRACDCNSHTKSYCLSIAGLNHGLNLKFSWIMIILSFDIFGCPCVYVYYGHYKIKFFSFVFFFKKSNITIYREFLINVKGRLLWPWQSQQCAVLI